MDEKYFLRVIVARSAVILISIGCSQIPPVQPVLQPNFNQKLSWILSLEDQRILRQPNQIRPDEIIVLESPEVILKEVGPDLIELVADPHPRLRRRAALALGRVGLSQSVPALVEALSDFEPEVRQMAAFALGLIGDIKAKDPLVKALGDVSPLVQGRAAEALGRIGALEAVPAIEEMLRPHVTSTFKVDPEELRYPQVPEVEAFRLVLYALTDLKAYDSIAAIVLKDNGTPVVWWWPVAYSLANLDDVRAVKALTAFVEIQGIIGVSYAAEALGKLGEQSAVQPLLELLDLERRDKNVVATALRALGHFKDQAVTEELRRFVVTKDLDPMLRIEAINALRGRHDEASVEIFVELMTDSWAPMRAASLRALAEAPSNRLMLILSGLEPDRDWRVRVALAEGLAGADKALATTRLMSMLSDSDRRVIPTVLSSLVELEAPGIETVLLEHLTQDDIVVRKSAANLLGLIKFSSAELALREAYLKGINDQSYLVRAAILEALEKINGPFAEEVLMLALDDDEWAVRIKAATLLDGGAADRNYREGIKPVPFDIDYSAPHLLNPKFSPHVYIETERGTIQIELAVLDAPLTTHNFMKLARSGFYDGLPFHHVVRNDLLKSGDPRGDGHGFSGIAQRDEVNQVPFLRGTVGISREWEDAGGSQFFITQIPRPNFDGNYTAFGNVINGMEILDKLEQGDRIKQIIVWDGVQSPNRKP